MLQFCWKEPQSLFFLLCTHLSESKFPVLHRPHCAFQLLCLNAVCVTTGHSIISGPFVFSVLVSLSKFFHSHFDIFKKKNKIKAESPRTRRASQTAEKIFTSVNWQWACFLQAVWQPGRPVSGHVTLGVFDTSLACPRCIQSVIDDILVGTATYQSQSLAFFYCYREIFVSTNKNKNVTCKV